MKTRRIPLIIGLVLALGTGALLLTYLTSLRPAGTAAQTRAVLVAIHDIPARSAATSDLFRLQPRSVDQIDSDAISNPQDMTGMYTLVPILAGSVATRSKIGVESAATLPATLAPGMRAVSIAIDNIKGVAGLITPGDRVDVIAIPPGTGEGAPRGYAILRGVLVLAMGDEVKTTAAPDAGPLNGPPAALTTITLALTSSQVDLIDGADLSSTLRLALRNPNEPAGAFPVERLQIATAGATPAEPVAAAPVAASAPPAPVAAQRANAGASGVIVIDGDHVAGEPATPP